jgi:hypothetical protein
MDNMIEVWQRFRHAWGDHWERAYKLTMLDHSEREKLIFEWVKTGMLDLKAFRKFSSCFLAGNMPSPAVTLPTLDALEAFADAATPGPWTTLEETVDNGPEHEPDYPGVYNQVTIHGKPELDCLVATMGDTGREAADRAFIAAAHPITVKALVKVARTAEVLANEVAGAAQTGKRPNLLAVADVAEALKPFLPAGD